jgi:hypothetical protein
MKKASISLGRVFLFIAVVIELSVGGSAAQGWGGPCWTFDTSNEVCTSCCVHSLAEIPNEIWNVISDSGSQADEYVGYPCGGQNPINPTCEPVCQSGYYDMAQEDPACECSPTGYSCSGSVNGCCTGLICRSDNNCGTCSAIGQSCGDNDDCCSGSCVGGTCASNACT